MAMSRSEDRTILVEIGILRPFSDVAGRHVIRFDGSTPRRQELAQRLEIAGCPVNLSGTDWHSAGDFEAALVMTSSGSTELEAVTDPTGPNDQHVAISDDAKVLLVEVVKDADEGNGAIVKHKTFGGTFIQTNGQNFSNSEERRSVARWEEAINELLMLGFLEDSTGGDSYFQVTHKGFEAAESLGGS